MRSLAIWALRDLRANPGVHLGLALLVALVVTIVSGSVRAGRYLQATGEGWTRRLACAEVEILHGPAPRGAAQEALRLPGVLDAEERLRTAGRLEWGEGRSLPAAVEVLPEDGPPRLDRLRLVQGRWPAPAEAAVLVDRSLAGFLPPGEGTRVTVRVGDHALALPVVGAVLSAQHLLMPIHPEHAFPVRHAMAPVWVSPAAVVEIPQAQGRSTCLLLALAPGADARAVARAAASLPLASALAVVPLEEQPAQRFLALTRAVFDAYLPIVNLVLSVLASVLLALVLRRHVEHARHGVAVWLSLGQRLPRLVLALLLPGLLTTAVGAGVGVLGHRPFALLLHDKYESSLGLPPVIDPGIGPEVAHIVALLLAVALLSSGLAALGLVRRAPARLLREGTRPGGALARRLAGSGRHLPTSILLGLTQSLSRPVAALGLLLALGGQFAVLLAFDAVHRSYEKESAAAARRAGLDAVVRFVAPRGHEALDDLARRAQGRAEPLLIGTALLSSPAGSRFVQLVGLDPAGWGADLRLWRGRHLDAQATGEALVDRWVADQLGLGVGSRLDLYASQSAPEGAPVTVVGVVEQVSVGRAYVSVATAQRLYDLPGQVNGAQVASALPAPDLEARLAAAPGVDRALAMGGAVDEVVRTLEGGRAVLRLALVLAALVAATFLAVVGAMDARDRMADAAVLHALGWRDRSLAVVIGVEMAARTGLALGLGVLGSTPLARLLLARLSEADRYTLGLHASAQAPWRLAALCLFVVPLAAAPACRALLRLTPARSLRLLARE